MRVPALFVLLRKITAVGGMTLRIAESHAFAGIGENGVGKSTLIKMIIGILAPMGDIRAMGRIRSPYPVYFVL